METAERLKERKMREVVNGENFTDPSDELNQVEKVEEIKGLLDRGIPAENLIYYGLEYKFITEYVIGKTSYDEMYRGLEIAIHQFAKRQMTWFRGMERRGFTIHWVDALQPMEKKVETVLELMRS